MPPKKKEETTNPYDRRLWEAASAGTLIGVENALAEGANPNIFRIPNDDNSVITYGDLTKYYGVDGGFKHKNPTDIGKDLRNQKDFITPLMAAAQNGDIRILEALYESGAEVNLSQPSITYSNGNTYGGLYPICYGLWSVDVTLWFIKRNSEIEFFIDGLPGHIDIPCPRFTPLLLATEITKQESVCRHLIEAGADVNTAAQRNTGTGTSSCRSDTSIACYWRSTITDYGSLWAKELIDNHGAEIDWPSEDVIRNTHIQFPGSHEGFGPTVLMTAVASGDKYMIEMLLEEGADPNKGEHKNIYHNAYGDHTICRTPLSVALENASVPESAIIMKGGHVEDIKDPYRAHPIINMLLEYGATKV
jgi:Ankyrin repeat